MAPEPSPVYLPPPPLARAPRTPARCRPNSDRLEGTRFRAGAQGTILGPAPEGGAPAFLGKDPLLLRGAAGPKQLLSVLLAGLRGTREPGGVAGVSTLPWVLAEWVGASGSPELVRRVPRQAILGLEGART